MRVTAEDGSEARAAEEGIGPPILVLHGGMGDETAWKPVTDRLRDRFRTVRLHRRRYRLDLPSPVPPPESPAVGSAGAGSAGGSMAEEVAHVRAVAGELDRPLLVGHSSGAVLALEALVADPDLYAGAVLYEPPLVIGEPLGGAKLAPARQALAADKPGRAITIFLREVVGLSPLSARLAGFFIGRHPQYRQRVVRQLDDNDAIDALGVRLEEYAQVEAPILLLGGDKSPAHLAGRLDALERALPRTRRLVMHGQGHSAERQAPERVARAIATFIDEELPAH